MQIDLNNLHTRSGVMTEAMKFKKTRYLCLRLNDLYLHVRYKTDLSYEVVSGVYTLTTSIKNLIHKHLNYDLPEDYEDGTITSYEDWLRVQHPETFWKWINSSNYSTQRNTPFARNATKARKLWANSLIERFKKEENDLLKKQTKKRKQTKFYKWADGI